MYKCTEKREKGRKPVKMAKNEMNTLLLQKGNHAAALSCIF